MPDFPLASSVALPALGEPFAKGEIAAELARLHAQATEFWGAIPDAAFFAPLGGGWSPAEILRHLDRSVRPVVQALRLPVPVLWLLFGPARAPSRSLAALREAYRARLAAGLTAGRYAPPPEPPPADPAAARRELMARRDLRARALLAAIGPWEERDLDRCRLPHPGLGKLTVREMLLFTLLHEHHHLEGAARKLGGADERAALDPTRS
jgi:hypothetical protein